VCDERTDRWTDGRADGQTDGIDIASTALAMRALRRAVKNVFYMYEYRLLNVFKTDCELLELFARTYVILFQWILSFLL